MKIGEYIRRYRESAGMSQREFAKVCDLSNAYISMIEQGVDPKTGKEIIPKIESCHKLARAMGMTVENFYRLLNDKDATFSPEVIGNYHGYINRKSVEQEANMLTDYRNLNVKGKMLAAKYIKMLLEDYRKEDGIFEAIPSDFTGDSGDDNE